VKFARSTALVPALVAVSVVVLQGATAVAGSDGAARPSAPARTFLVQELNFVFVPDPASVPIGTTIRWANPVLNDHTTTGNAPLSLWDSGLMDWHDTYTRTFTAAGTYGYFCTIHTRFDMTSNIRVPAQAEPPSGPTGTVFTVTVASTPAPTDYVYDVQKANPGGTWQDWMMGVTTVSVEFDSTGQPTGPYRFRSRLHRVSDDAASDWSPKVSVIVQS
jgi:plastocyanin